MDVSISGNLQELWIQLAETPQAKQWKNLDRIYQCQAIFLSMLGLAGRKAASRGWAGKFLDWIYLFQAISRNLGFSWQKSFPHPGTI